MKELTETEKRQLAEDVRKEFPGDDVMQQVHYVRLLHHAQTKGLSSQDRIRFYNSAQVRAQR